MHLIKCILIYIRSKCILRCSGLFLNHIKCTLLYHIKIKSHIGTPVTVKEINRIFFCININILTRCILMHKIKILKLTVTVTNKIKQYYRYIYKPTIIRSNIILLHTCTECTSDEKVNIELFLQWSRV